MRTLEHRIEMLEKRHRELVKKYEYTYNLLYTIRVRRLKQTEAMRKKILRGPIASAMAYMAYQKKRAKHFNRVSKIIGTLEAEGREGHRILTLRQSERNKLMEFLRTDGRKLKKNCPSCLKEEFDAQTPVG